MQAELNHDVNIGEAANHDNVMARLREIKISASPDFSLNAKLYDLEQKTHLCSG